MTKLKDSELAKERFLNYRPICLVCIFLLLGSVFGFYILNNIPLTIIATCLCFIILLVIAVLKRHIKYFLIPIISFVIGIGAYYLSINSFNSTINYVPIKIEARINTVGRANSKYLKIEADSCVFDSKKINDNIVIYISDSNNQYENIEVGSVIKFKPYNFYHTGLFSNGIPNANVFSNDCKYTASVKIENVEYVKTDKTFAENVKSHIKNEISKGLNEENTNLAYSALFGDKSTINLDQYDALRSAGVAHLLAVSGLHVGIIVAVLCLILKLFKSNDVTKFCVISVFLTLYMYICGFSVSVVRASIMAILLLLSKVVKGRYDSFTALGIAGILIYLFNPLCIFDISFLMSFGCGISIAMLFKPIKTLIVKAHIPEIIASSISMSLSTTVGLMFIMAFFFKTLNVVSLISNLVIIPLFTIAFVPVFIVSCLSFIPFICYLLYPINFVFALINLVANFFASLKFLIFNTVTINYIAIIVYFLLLLFIGRLCKTRFQYKIAITLPIVALLIICLI